MTSRSYDSTASRRSGKERMTDDDVYQYALRVSYLNFLLTAKAPEPSPQPQPREQNRDSFHAARIGGVFTQGLSSVAELFKDPSKDGQKSVKFPEKLIGKLDSKMRDIAMGRDPQYTDQYIRSVIAVFWGSLKASESGASREASSASWRQIRENRKIEELILFFVTTATQQLRKNPALGNDGWKTELNAQISQFVLILRECLRTVHHVPPEITSRLEMYTAKLTDGVVAVESRAGSSSRSSIYGAQSPAISTAALSGPAPPPTIHDMPLVKTLVHLFSRTDDDLQRDVNAIRRFCTEKAALIDLKTCLKNINADMPFPGRREDFETPEGYNLWRTQETSVLSQHMVLMMQINPELAKSIPSTSTSPTSYTSQRPSSAYSTNNGYGPGNGFTPELDPIADSVGDEDEIQIGHNFTYIPPNPKKCYKRLLELCIHYDLEAMVHLPEDQEVSLGILSPRHVALLNDCALRWLVSHQYRVSCFLDIIQATYEKGDVPIECVPEGMAAVAKAVHDLELSKWSNADFDYVSTTYGALCTMFLRAIFEAFEDISNLKAQEIGPYVAILEAVQTSGLVERYKHDISAHLLELENHVHRQAIHQYTEKSTDEHSKSGVNRALPLLYLTDYLEKQAKLLDKRFPEPLLGTLDIVSVVLDSQTKCFLSDLDNARIPLLQASQMKPPEVPLQDIFSLYSRVKTVLDMHTAFCPKTPTHYDVSSYFEPYVLQWLINTDMQTTQWVHTAISIDKFEAEGPEGHSSSIVDMFANLKSPIDRVMELKWPDKYQEARFFTALSKTVSKLMEEYCRRIEDLFMDEMFPRQATETLPVKQYAILEKAKLIVGDKKVEPFNFTPSSCVKLNNIEAARGLLDQIYARIDVDRISEVLEEHGPPTPEKVERPRFLFTVKVVLAEGLVPTDASPSAKLDTFVTLSDEKGFRLAKTRTIFESLNPRWDETFDISVESSLWLMASVRDRAVIGKHDSVGRGYLFLDPRRFGDYLAHDLWLDLDTVGRILIRVSMEGEKDDPQFYFGRAFRSLKRAEGDMVRVIIDKMAPLIRQYVNRNVLSALIKSTQVGYDYNKAIAGVTGFYRSAIGADKADSVIPLPPKDKPRFRTEALTDEEMENAISPLFDYFDANLQTFNSYLSSATKEIVMLKIWKELLATIEELLVPPLSDVPSELKPLAEKEVDIVFQWLKFLKDFMYAGGEGVPLEQIQNQRYRDILSIRLYYDMSTDSLMEECVRLMQQNLRGATTVKKRAKTVYSQRNLGTIKERKREKKEDAQQGNGDMILRILRMRPKTSEFIAQQLQVVTAAQADQEKRAADRRGTARNRNRFSRTGVPPLPPLPS